MALPPDLIDVLSRTARAARATDTLDQPPPHISVGGGGGPLPPDMHAALGAAPGGGDGDAPADAKAADLIRQAIELLHEATRAEKDEQDKAAITQCLAALQKVLAKDQQESDGLLQGKATPAALRSAAGG